RRTDRSSGARDRHPPHRLRRLPVVRGAAAGRVERPRSLRDARGAVVKAAIIGLGRMGGPLVGHAVGAGIEVSACDIHGPAAEAAAATGASVSASAADAAAGAEVVAVVVFDDQQVRDVLTGPDGALQALRPGAVVAIHTTTTLQTIRDV